MVEMKKTKCPEGMIYDKKLKVCRPIQNKKDWLEVEIEKWLK